MTTASTANSLSTIKGLSFVLAGMLLGAGIATATAVSADTGSGPFRCAPEDREAVEEAIAEGNYEQWRSLMDGTGRGSARILDVVNADNFSVFQKMHEAMEEGRYDDAALYRQELGLGLGMGPMHRTGAPHGHRAYGLRERGVR